MFSSRARPSYSSSFSDDEASDDEPAVIIEKIEQVYQNGEKYIKTENYESQKQTSNQNNEIDENINSLCRICSSKGLISINSSLTSKLMVLTPMHSDRSAWQRPISRLIAEVSGEEVSFLLSFEIE